MSLILDALQRSQEEREQGGRAPGLAVQHHRLNTSGRRPLRWLPWAGLALSLGAVAWLLLERTPTDLARPGALPPEAAARKAAEPEAVAAAAVAPAAAERDATVREATVPDAPVPTPTAAAPAAGAAVADTAHSPPGGGGRAAAAAARSGAPAVERTAAAGRTGRAAPQGSGAADDAVAALYRSAGSASAGRASAASAPAASAAAAAAAAPAPESASRPAAASTASGGAAPADDQALDVDLLVQAAQTALERKQPEPQVEQEHSAPLLADLSQASKDAIPTLIYTGHDYTGGPDSAVMINNRRLSAGGSAGAGVKVEEVLENSVVLSYRGTRFRLRALNSWVNL